MHNTVIKKDPWRWRRPENWSKATKWEVAGAHLTRWRQGSGQVVYEGRVVEEEGVG